eukprot:9338511-Lingulodinium_polyedra.AAC.1
MGSPGNAARPTSLLEAADLAAVARFAWDGAGPPRVRCGEGAFAARARSAEAAVVNGLAWSR